MFIRLFSLFLLLVFCSCSGPRLMANEQILSGKIYWQGEIRLHGDVVLAEGAELTIAPGTKVIFEPPHPGEDLYQEHPYFTGSELIVRGRLISVGTAEAPITFTSDDPEDGPDSWGGLNIEESPEVHFSYVHFEQANSAVHSRRSWVTIDHSVFRRNLFAVRFHDTQMLLENNLFENNGTAIRFHLGGPVIRNNLIRNNEKGIFISSEPQDYRIENNIFLLNRPYQISLGEGVRQNVDLQNNFWSEKAGDDLEAFFFDGRIDDWLGTINYLPVRQTPPALESD